MRKPRVLVCATQIPFAFGGGEILSQSLRDELAGRGFEVDLVTLPFNWTSRLRVLKSSLAWRLLDLTEVAGERVDLVICTRFPSYLIPHPNKVVWLIHQFRQVYDLVGTDFTDFADRPEDRAVMEMVRTMDGRTLSEARFLYTISRNVAERLKRFNGLMAKPLYPPPRHVGHYRCEGYEDFVFTVGRLDPIKRFDMLVRALPHTREPVRAVIAGQGIERERLGALARRLGVEERVELPGWIDDERLLDLYARCLGVFYGPLDEDYGYVTVEAFMAEKPVLTASDSGGVLEFVEDERNGFVVESSDPRALAGRLDRLYRDRELARRLGRTGAGRVEGIGWDRVVTALTGWEEIA